MSRHQLVVLGVISGTNFPSVCGGKLVVRAQLGGVWLLTEEVEASSNPVFEKQLAWEVTNAQLRQCRSRKVMLRVEAWRDKDMLGHVMLPLRSAVPLNADHIKAPVNTHRLIGSSASLDLSLGLEEVEKISQNISEDEIESGQTSTKDRPRRSETLSPVLMEKDDGSGGYFLIGPEVSCDQKFSLSICLVCIENLHLVPAKSQILSQQDPFYFQYHLLGVDISTEQFLNLDKPEFVSEKATAVIHSNQDCMRQFLSSAGISIKLCHGATVLGAAEVELGNVLPDSGDLENKHTFQGNVDMVSAHNLTVAVDENGNKARIGVMIVFEKQELNVSTGMLSDVEMEEEESEVIYNNNDEDRINTNDKVINDRCEVNMSADEEEFLRNKNKSSSAGEENVEKSLSQSFRPGSPPTKLPHTETVDSQILSRSKTVEAQSLPEPVLLTESESVKPPVAASLPKPTISGSISVESLNPIADTTDYLSPPPLPTKSYKLSIELKTLHLKDPTTSYTDSVLAYKYLALHKEVIATPSFTLYGDKVIQVPGGYCQFSFAVQEEKMKQTFRAHLLKVGLYVGGQMRGKTSIDLSNVINGGVWSGSVELVGSEGFLGHLSVDLLLEHGDRQQLKESNVHTTDMLAMAARELEAWKMDQKKKFNDSLVQVEVQHLTLLGKEWREREKEREKSAQEQVEKIKVLEQELRLEIEKMEVQKKEMDEARRKNDIEREKIEREKIELKNEKVVLVEKLKQQVKEKDALVAIKSAEVESLMKKLDASKLELDKGTLEKNANKMMDDEIKAELVLLRAEKTTWGSSMEQADREKRFYMENCEQLRKEVVQLQLQKERTYTDQIAGLERQVADLSKRLLEKKEVPVKNINVVELLDETGRDVETQTPETQTERSPSVVSLNNTEEAARLGRLEENLAMVLRTGVYGENDRVVVQLREQIRKKREKLRQGSFR